MPTCRTHKIGPVLRAVLERRPRPRSVLDVGCGCGKWGVLLREYLDPSAAAGQAPRRVRIDAVEGYGGYIGPLHQIVYDRVIVGRAPAILVGLGRYDLVMAVDMLEHFDRADGAEFVAHCRRLGAVLLTTPASPIEQGAVHGNELERHRSAWSPSELAALGAHAVQPIPRRGRTLDWLAYFSPCRSAGS